jgi:hypothetical protein
MISLLEIAKSITEADVDDDKIIKYKNKDGESKEMKASSAKKMDKEHPAKIAYDKMAGKGDDDSEKDSGGKLGGSDFDRDGGEEPSDDEPKDDKPKGDKPKGERPATIHLDYDQADDDLDSIRYAGSLSDNPGLVANIGDMVKLIQSGHATDDDIQRANDIRDKIDDIDMTNPDAGLDKVDMALKAAIDSHNKPKGEPKGDDGADDVEPVKYKVGKGIPTSDVKVDQETKDTILQDFNPPRDAERDENGLPTNEEDWDKEMTEVESMFEKARDAYEAAEKDASDAAFDDDEEEADYLSDRATQALVQYEKYKKVRDAYEAKGEELGVFETITLNGKQYKPIKESKESNPRIFKEIYDRTFRSLK